VIEWLLFNANSAISWREQVTFQLEDDKVCFVLDQHIRKGALKHGNYHFTFWSPFYEFSGQNLKINLPFSYTCSKPKETNKKTSVFVSCYLTVFSEEKIYVYQAIGLPTKWPSFYNVIAIILHNKGLTNKHFVQGHTWTISTMLQFHYIYMVSI